MSAANAGLFGRVALAAKVITPDQLELALREQQRLGTDQSLGEVLVQLGMLTPAQLERLLEMQRSVIAKARAKQGESPNPAAPVPAAAPPQAPTRPPPPARPAPVAQAQRPSPSAPAGPAAPPAAAAHAAPPVPPAPLPDLASAPAPAGETADATDDDIQLEEASAPIDLAGTTHSSELTVREELNEIDPQVLEAASELPSSTTAQTKPTGSLRAALEQAAKQGASDLHVHSGSPLRLRARGQFGDFGQQPVSTADAQRLIGEVLSNEDREILERKGEVDFSFELPGVARVRANAYRQLRGLDAAFRIIPPEPPTLESLGLDPKLAKLTTYHQGMLLVTGPARCGKSSTLAALVRLINEERREHVLCIEDPIEYRHLSKRCLVNQRSVLRHTESFSRALRAALREDPDVIVIGELRDSESIALALTAAETGHFVLGTLHTDNSIRTINRIIGAFSPDQHDQVRAMLSESLRAVISQRLVPKADGSGLALAHEVMINNLAIGNLIRENKTIQMRSILQTGGDKGMHLLDQTLAKLVQSGEVKREEALRHCEDPKMIPAK